MALVCPSFAGPQTAELDLASDPLFPYVVALLVTGVALTVVGLAALQLGKPRAQRGRGRAPDDRTWWICLSCEATNPGDRSTCFECHAVRTVAGPAKEAPSRA